jgi:succinate dehydrogenase/fumarate reductase flavoprotein subunit
MADHSFHPEVVPNFLGEFSAVRVDHGMKTTLPGLWAVGDTCFTGSAWAGAVPAPPGRMRGAGLMFAAISALFAAPDALKNAVTLKEQEINEEQVKKYKDEIFAPMDVKLGKNPREYIADLKEVVAPPRYSVRKHEERLEEALEKLEIIKSQLSQVTPEDDWHLLGLYHDLRNMLQCAEIYFSSSLHRKESRGWHFREDYPARDDKNWLKWTIAKDIDGKLTITSQDVPIERYQMKP